MPRANLLLPLSPAEASDRGQGAAKPGLSLPERSSQIDESGFFTAIGLCGAEGRTVRVAAKARRRHRRRHSADGLTKVSLVRAAAVTRRLWPSSAEVEGRDADQLTTPRDARFVFDVSCAALL